MKTFKNIIEKLYTSHFDTLREDVRTIQVDGGLNTFAFDAHIDIINSHKSILTITECEFGHILLEVHVNASIFPDTNYLYTISYVDWDFDHTIIFPNDITIKIIERKTEE